MSILQLYDTARQAIVPFEPGDHVLMYTCGITPYDATHLGHAATFIAYDVLQRHLIDKGHTVKCVRNVTDVDDPLFAKARQLGVHYLDLAAGEEARFERDMVALNALPVASHAARIVGDPRHPRLHRHGARSRLRLPGRRRGVLRRVQVRLVRVGQPLHRGRDDRARRASAAAASTTRNKRHPLDFVLWHPSADDEPSWDTMWGPGRPGWHIECSALALRELGTTIDLHGGGTDLIFPHHECERAQSEAATGEPFVRHWMHTALISKDGAKMSKSLGNLVFVDKLRTEYDPMAIRLALIEHHYRTEWEWDDELMPRNVDAARGAGAAPPTGDRATCSTRCASGSTTTSTRRARSPPSIDAAAAWRVDRGRGGAARRRPRELRSLRALPDARAGTRLFTQISANARPTLSHVAA